MSYLYFYMYVCKYLCVCVTVRGWSGVIEM